MNINVGGVDRSLRIVAGIAIITWGILFENIWGALGVVFIITGLVKWCPLYLPFGVKTCKIDEIKNKT